MKNTVLLFGLTLFTAISCSQKDPICDCIKASDELNKETKALFTHTPTEKDVKKVKELRKKKKKACVDFQEMSGKEMLKRKETCK